MRAKVLAMHLWESSRLCKNDSSAFLANLCVICAILPLHSSHNVALSSLLINVHFQNKKIFHGLRSQFHFPFVLISMFSKFCVPLFCHCISRKIDDSRDLANKLS